MSSRSYYELLQVDPNASPEVISAAYRSLRQPRQFADATSDEHDAARQISAHGTPAELAYAYAILSDPLKRQAYDASLQRPPIPALSNSPEDELGRYRITKAVYFRYLFITCAVAVCSALFIAAFSTFARTDPMVAIRAAEYPSLALVAEDISTRGIVNQPVTIDTVQSGAVQSGAVQSGAVLNLGENQARVEDVNALDAPDTVAVTEPLPALVITIVPTKPPEPAPAVQPATPTKPIAPSPTVEDFQRIGRSSTSRSPISRSSISHSSIKRVSDLGDVSDAIALMGLNDSPDSDTVQVEPLLPLPTSEVGQAKTKEAKLGIGPTQPLTVTGSTTSASTELLSAPQQASGVPLTAQEQ